MGRVAIELARRGIDVVGVDLDDDLLDFARRSEPSLRWVHADLATMRLDRTFDVVRDARQRDGVLPTHRPRRDHPQLRCPPRAARACWWRGFQLESADDSLTLARLRRDVHVTAASNWPSDGRRGSATRTDAGNYAVSVHRRG